MSTLNLDRDLYSKNRTTNLWMLQAPYPFIVWYFSIETYYTPKPHSKR
jgi:hypothetical protein